MTGVSAIQDGRHSRLTFENTFSQFTDNKLNFSVVVAESAPAHTLSAARLLRTKAAGEESSR